MTADELLEEALERLGDVVDQGDHGDPDLKCGAYEEVAEIYMWLSGQIERLRLGIGRAA